MNVLYLINELNYTDGVSNHIYHLLNELKNNSGINLYLCCGGGNAIEKFTDSGFKVIINANLNHKNRTYTNFLNATKDLIKAIKKNKIDILHSHNHYAANISFISSKFTRAKTVQTNHGLIPEEGLLKHFNAHYYIAVNEHILEYILNNKIASRKNVKLIRHGIPHHCNSHKKEYDKIKIICASRLINEKGVDKFIEAAAFLKKKNKNNLKFYLCGTGDLENSLKVLNNKLNAGVEFLGEVKDLTKILSSSHIFVMPTRSKSEGFPMAIAEAALTKNLIITSDFKGHESILKDQREGLIFKTDNAQELAAKIKFAIDNPILREKIIQTFYLKARELFNINTMANKHLSLYQTALNTN